MERTADPLASLGMTKFRVTATLWICYVDVKRKAGPAAAGEKSIKSQPLAMTKFNVTAALWICYVDVRRKAGPAEREKNQKSHPLGMTKVKVSPANLRCGM
jgi:hypothetical protein